MDCLGKQLLAGTALTQYQGIGIGLTRYPDQPETLHELGGGTDDILKGKNSLRADISVDHPPHRLRLTQGHHQPLRSGDGTCGDKAVHHCATGQTQRRLCLLLPFPVGNYPFKVNAFNDIISNGDRPVYNIPAIAGKPQNPPRPLVDIGYFQVPVDGQQSILYQLEYPLLFPQESQLVLQYRLEIFSCCSMALTAAFTIPRV